MSLLDRFFGAGVRRPLPQPAAAQQEPTADDQALSRYRYLLRTAPPETIEQAHAEAFARLTPEQRRRVLEELAADLPPAERAAATRNGDDAGALARTVTRAELREPGTLERVFGGIGASPGMPGMGLGGLMAGSFVSSMAGTVLGSMIAQHFMGSHPEASHLSGNVAGDAGAGAVPNDPFHTADSLGSASGDDRHAPTFTGDSADAADVDPGGDAHGDAGFDTGFDDGGFDV